MLLSRTSLVSHIKNQSFLIEACSAIINLLERMFVAAVIVLDEMKAEYGNKG